MRKINNNHEIFHIEKMGLDIDKIKVKKDTKDAQQKAHQLFKKATSAINFANKAQKRVNERIAEIGEGEINKSNNVEQTGINTKSTQFLSKPSSALSASKNSASK